MDKDNFKPAFDYGSITEEQLEVVEEVINVLKQMGDDVAAELLTHKFKFVEPPKVDHTQSPFVKCCNELGIPVNLQGYVEDDGIGYPLVILSEDIRNLDKLYVAIKNAE